MSRDSGSEQPTQRTVAELLAEYGDGSQKSARRRRRRAEDPTETAPQAIIDRVLSDSGQMRAVGADGKPVSPSTHRPTPQGTPPPANNVPPPNAAPPSNAAPQAPAPPPPQAPASPPPPPNAAPPPPPANAAPPPAPPGADHAPAPENDDPAFKANNANFWAQRFAAAGSASAKPPPPAEPEAAPGPGDTEATLQQQALPRRPQPFPRTPPALPPGPGTGPHAVEGVTEQLPPVRGNAGAEGTALVPFDQGAAQAPEVSDPYDFEPYEDDDAYETTFADPDYGDSSYGDSSYGATSYDDEGYDPELPAGLDAEDYLPEADAEADEPEVTSGKDWAVFALQGCAGLLGGGLVWFGFRWLWSEIAVAALVAALVVTGCLVFVARRFLRTDDIQTILLAVLVGLICTVSPAALLLIGQ